MTEIIGYVIAAAVWVVSLVWAKAMNALLVMQDKDIKKLQKDIGLLEEEIDSIGRS